MDNRSGAFNVWYRDTKDNGSNWSADVKLSNKSTGAPYKSVSGFGAPYGDYAGLSVLNNGQSIAIFGEAGLQQVSPGGIWVNRSLPASTIVQSPKSGQNITEEKSQISIKALPNPYTDEVRLLVDNPVTGFVRLDIADIYGRQIRTIYEGMLDPGRHQFIIPAQSIPGHEFIYILKSEGKTLSGKLVTASGN